ncbi:hypothetical protein TTHERM_00218650 (macronuclear) [Tetrahymena thermophila SB210]|uniref:Uncharacterized protein n=1 Tax=Tetrahymena thermophila (strain SB210) TaxID=312017 RepID=I7MFL1_TETTS|nr:hypothetical protein TTHERM_00218650 [Tetrahymena thermophila SB210]EAS00292.1 hypothetical protein TTHERM_00218650 [Tetrahymena thermophila SB210]|eukprot:XP_001020537.1 hypothetical protein TTHERM_00218650 [Tetrahymena thermophila SB210]
MDQNNYQYQNNQNVQHNTANLCQSNNYNQVISNQQVQQSELQALQNSQAFKQLQKQIQKMRKYYLSIGYTQKQVTDMLHDILLRKQNQEIDWKKLSNTSDYYTVLERYNSTSQIAESALKFKKEINQMKSQHKNNIIPSQQKSEFVQEQQLQINAQLKNNNNDAINTQNSSKINNSLFTNSKPNIFNNQSQESQNFQSQQNNNFNNNNHNQIQSTISKQNDIQQQKEKCKGLNVNEISDRFLYRLDRNCQIEKSSSSSESSDQDSYHYKISSGFIQSEHDLEYSTIKKQASQNQQIKDENMNNRQEENSVSMQMQESKNQKNRQKSTFSENLRLNFPEISSELYGKNSIQNVAKEETVEQSGQYHNMELDYIHNDYSINEESYNSYNNESQIPLQQKKKKIRKQKGFFQEQIPSILEQNEILIEKQKKKVCRNTQYRDDISVIVHNFAGKKRNHKFMNQFQVQESNEYQDISELDELQLLEKKFRYFTEDLIDEDQNSQQ